MERFMVLKFIAHSYKVLSIATKFGWLPGARYTNLRDVRNFDQVGFIDINWKNYNFKKHLDAVKQTNPLLTVAQDIICISRLSEIIEQAEELSIYAKQVIVVPKDPSLANNINSLIPSKFLLGYSVPTKYGKTSISPKYFQRPVHLLGGRPDVQRKLAKSMPVVSFDCNRFTLDATFGDYFVGDKFIPHPIGGYENCIESSLREINLLWNEYRG